MERRRFLALVGAGGLAGCLGSGQSDPSDDETPGTNITPSTPESSTAQDAHTPDEQTPQTAVPETTPTPTEIPMARLGVPATICEESVEPDFHIRAIVEPATADSWEGYEIADTYRSDDQSGLAGDSVVVGLAGNGFARAYPFDVIYHHEIVNDRLGATSSDGADSAGDIAGPVMVTYCSLCRSGMVARRTVEGQATTFEVSGLLWRPPQIRAVNSQEKGRTRGITRSETATDVRNAGNLVMYDHATRSYWSQILARAICGPQRGTRLQILPTTVTTWDEWQTAHPETDVLLPPPHSTSA